LTVQDQHNFSINLSRLLLKKGIGFCLYRFPTEEIFYVAIQKKILNRVQGANSNAGEDDFIISPFIENQVSSKVFLQKYSEDGINDSFFEMLDSEPDREVDWGPLPESISKSDYFEKCDKYLADIRSGQLSKAILSRVILQDKPASLDVFSFYTALAKAYPETFTSLFYIPGMGIWTGASPELLLQKKDKEYATMALAASQPKEITAEYAWRKKEQQEHSMVREHIEEIFSNNNWPLLISARYLSYFSK
jgi:isochorismate synthase